MNTQERCRIQFSKKTALLVAGIMCLPVVWLTYRGVTDSQDRGDTLTLINIVHNFHQSENPAVEAPDQITNPYQSDKETLGNAMQVVLSDRSRKKSKSKLAPPNSAVKEMIAEIHERTGIAPSQKTLQSYISQKCLEAGLQGSMERPRLAYFNEEHKLLYVGNPKCGSTSFKKFLLKLGGDERDYREMTNVHNEDENPLLRSLWDETVEFQEEVLRTYYKVTFVRNPLVRLVSGYRNKILRHPRSSYITMIRDIIQKGYGAEAASNWMPWNKYRPSFDQFVEYLLNDDFVYKNYHWAPYAENIQLCGMRYDLIALLETANQHIEDLKLNVPSLKDVPFPLSRSELSVDGFSSEELTTLAFSNLTNALRDGVYRLYENEINLLGYSVIGQDKFPFINLTEVETVKPNLDY